MVWWILQDPTRDMRVPTGELQHHIPGTCKAISLCAIVYEDSLFRLIRAENADRALVCQCIAVAD